MSSKCTAAKAYDILGIYDFPDNFDALNGLHSYLYTNSDMVAVLADVDGDGLPLIAALRPGANAVSGGRCVPGTIVCSVYGKPESYFLHKMQQMPQRVLYQDIEKGRELDARAKLQLFGGNIASPDLDRKIIRLPECIVKLQAGSAPTEATRVQQESRDMASGSHALGAARPAFGTPAMNRPIDSNLE